MTREPKFCSQTLTQGPFQAPGRAISGRVRVGGATSAKLVLERERPLDRGFEET